MFDYLMLTSPERQKNLDARGLTPNDARALWSLDETEGRPIGSLARDWGCDPSNATFIVDRLERAGLAERRPDTKDRRVKLVVLTRRGAESKQALLEENRRPPPGLSALQDSELEALVSILEKLPRAGD